MRGCKISKLCMIKIVNKSAQIVLLSEWILSTNPSQYGSKHVFNTSSCARFTPLSILSLWSYSSDCLSIKY